MRGREDLVVSSLARPSLSLHGATRHGSGMTGQG